MPSYDADKVCPTDFITNKLVIISDCGPHQGEFDDITDQVFWNSRKSPAIQYL